MRTLANYSPKAIRQSTVINAASPLVLFVFILAMTTVLMKRSALIVPMLGFRSGNTRKGKSTARNRICDKLR